MSALPRYSNTMTDYRIPADGEPISTEAAAMDFIGEAIHAGADRIVFPVSCLPPEFFRLSTGLAGAILQKCTNDRLKVAIVGDVSAYVAQGKPLPDFVYESNGHGAVRFVLSEADLDP